MMTNEELLEMREEQAKKLERILSSPELLEKIAKEEYGDNWKIIFSGEHHPNNQRK